MHSQKIPETYRDYIVAIGDYVVVFGRPEEMKTFKRPRQR